MPTLLLCLMPSAALAMRGPRVESAAVTAPGHVAIEFEHRLQYSPVGERRQQQLVTLSSGLGAQQQLDLTVPWRVEHSADTNAAFGDITLMHKTGAVSSWAEGRGLVGIVSRTVFPTSKASRVGKDNYRFETGFLMTQASETSTLSMNMGAVVQTNGDELMRYGAGVEKVWKRVGLFGEVLGFTDFSNNDKNEVVTGSGGIEVLIGKRFTLDVGGEIGITTEAPNWGTFLGASITF